MPGDIVLGKSGVVVFIPPQLVEKVVKTSEVVRLRECLPSSGLEKGTPAVCC
ncbi:MAG TPA: hypothetical protein VF540_04030 [Segetibacter sp.]